MERGGPIFTGRHAGEITRPEVGEDTSEPRLAALDVRDEVGLDAGLLRRAQHDRLVQQPEPELACDYSRDLLSSGAIAERDADGPASHAATLHRSPELERWTLQATVRRVDGVHDMGGMHGFGAVVRPGDELPYHERWEPRVFALQTLVSAEGLGAGPGGRATREEMD